MKWFKHESTAIRDEKLQEIIEQFGMMGYGVYFALVELVAEKLDKDNGMRPEVEIRWFYFRRLMKMSRQKTIAILSSLARNSLITLKIHEDFAHISIPKLLARLDEWTKRSGVTQEPLRYKNKSKNKNKNKIKNKIKNKNNTISITDEEFIKRLKENHGSAVDVDKEIGKIKSWLLANPTRKATKQFVVNWMNRAVDRQREVNTGSGGGHSTKYDDVK